jgi:sec-independent protein translocase protein TatA
VKEVVVVLDIGAPELIIILVILLLIMGPSKLAGLGGSLGKGIREFRTALKPEDEPEALKAPEDGQPASTAAAAQANSAAVPVSTTETTKP